jgi:hypothetical protein
MGKGIASGLKTTFLVHLVVGGVFGLAYLLIPEQFMSLFNWPIKDVFIARMMGAAVIGIASTSWFAYKQTGWENIKIVVQMEIVYTVLGTLVTLWGLLFAGIPVAGWLNAVILACFAAAFTYFYTKH